jgi:hypothetical protein
MKECEGKLEQSPGITRHGFLKSPLALAAGSVLMPSLLANFTPEAKAQGKATAVTITGADRRESAFSCSL